MSNFIDEITYASRKYEKRLKKSILPLEKLGITYYAIQRVMNDGHWHILSSNPTWIEYSAGNQLFLYDPSLIDPKHYQTGICYVNSHDNDDFRNIFCKHSEGIFDLGNCLAIIKRTADYCEFSFLATKVKNKKIINTYLNKMSLLQEYINYFKSSHSNIFNLAYEHNVDLKEINNSYFNINNIIDISHDVDDSSEVKNNILFHSLSQREQQCVKYFLNGKTAKETSLIIGLSYRTIEDYFTNIKKKLGCRNKRDLLNLFNNTF